jgi:hypothetical protein
MKYCSYESEKVRAAAREVLEDFNTAAMEWKTVQELEEQMELEHVGDGYSEDEDKEESDYDWFTEESFDVDDDELPF